MVINCCGVSGVPDDTQPLAWATGGGSGGDEGRGLGREMLSSVGTRCDQGPGGHGRGVHGAVVYWAPAVFQALHLALEVVSHLP